MFDRLNEGRWWDFGWKLVEGCTKCSPACNNCWSLAMEKRFGKPEEVKYFPERLARPLKRKKPAAYAIWNDLFHESVPFEFIYDVFFQMYCADRHTYQVLTKRPERMLEFYQWLKDRTMNHILKLDNVWLGVTAENQEMADKRIPILLQTPAAKRFISIEPMLGAITFDWKPYHHQATGETYREYLERKGSVSCNESLKMLDMVICGGESGPGARPMHPDWARGLRDQCGAAGVDFYFKQWGAWADATDDDADKSGTGDHIFKADGTVLGVGFRHRRDCHGSVDPEWKDKGGAWMTKVGKKKAGHLLDGVEHRPEF